MVAEDDHEVFEIVDDQNQVVGREHRSICHKLGLKHRAVYCFVFNPQGLLLIQQRSADKKIGPLQWDLSVAEHLVPGETYVKAVQRGLQEELGLTIGTDEIQGPLGPNHLRRLDLPGAILDIEFVESYKVVGWSGDIGMDITLDPQEVKAVKLIALHELRASMAAEPELYTQWFREEIAMLNWCQDIGSLPIRNL